MIEYADHHVSCRHHFILKLYLETPRRAEGCTVCDNCLAKADSAARFPTEEETVAIQKALSCAGARGRTASGADTLLRCLVGSRSKEVLGREIGSSERRTAC